MPLSSELLKILVCPITKKKLIYDESKEELISPHAGVIFPIVDGIPMMLVDQAKKIDPQRLQKILEKHSLSEKELLEKIDSE